MFEGQVWTASITMHTPQVIYLGKIDIAILLIEPDSLICKCARR